MRLIEEGIPSVVLVTERFTALAKSSMKGKGVPDAPMVVLPKTELTEYVGPEVVRSVARETVESVVSQLVVSGAAGVEENGPSLEGQG